MILGQYGAIGWYLVVLGQYRVICDGSGSVQGGTDRYMVALGQLKAVLVGTWWYWVSRRRY